MRILDRISEAELSDLNLQRKEKKKEEKKEKELRLIGIPVTLFKKYADVCQFKKVSDLMNKVLLQYRDGKLTLKVHKEVTLHGKGKNCQVRVPVGVAEEYDVLGQKLGMQGNQLIRRVLFSYIDPEYRDE